MAKKKELKGDGVHDDTEVLQQMVDAAVPAATVAPPVDAPAMPAPGNHTALDRLACCFFMAFKGKMQTLPDGLNIFVLARILEDFILANRDAPVEAVLMQVQIKIRLAPWKDEDPRQVRLALELFRSATLGLNAIERADYEAELAAKAAAERAARPHVPLRDDERTMRGAGHDFAPSDFGKALPEG